MDYKKQLVLWQKRRAKMIALRNKGLSYAAIGKSLTPKISRQRVYAVFAEIKAK